MSLGRWIREVLEYRSEVGVPGIGVFKKTHFPASYYAKEQVFLPPYDQIDLLEEGENALELVDYLQVRYQLDRSGAATKLDGVLSLVFSNLNAGKVVYLDSLGHLENDRNVLKFSPVDIDRFGFEAIPESPSVPADTTLSSETVESGPRSSNNWILVMGLFLIAVVIGGIWFFFTPSGTRVPASTATVAQQGASNVATGSVQERLSVEEVAQTVESIGSDTALLGSMLNPASGLPDTTFEIIVGSHQSIDEAAEHMQRLKNQGFNQVRVLATAPGSRLHKVSWGAYPSQEDARAVLREVQQRVERDAWIDQINR